ncbi:hypothetical protein GMORB2_7646 [Geosmithia morbida]|uniref:Uncharacterized protein n=1 Tax=Geosmithia morbida TaxID=1094350 RepID=A0A9P4YUR0_9HYPO|nr:uncharacterized protein GMORB2_7646 [Geosmithia morbida]KAF4122053.1 hypothetical protein GMORB2_7646 [Geosmithia morbida]
MPLEQTVTIVNNSGKIISTGKQLLNIFKEAKGAYQEKKAQVKTEKAQLQRARTFESYAPAHSHHPRDQYADYYEAYDDYDEKDDYFSPNPHHRHGPSRSRSVHEAGPPPRSSRRSAAGSVSGSAVSRPRRHHSTREHRGARSARPALTENNLKTLSEVSSTAPSQRAPAMSAGGGGGASAYHRSPYAETQYDARNYAVAERYPSNFYVGRRSSVGDAHGHPESAYRSPPSTPESDRQGRRKSIDMNLAYGDVPPDLEDRIELDPDRQEEAKEKEARDLVNKVETILDEVQCVRHSANHTITHLQKNPDSAAAVALTLAELSSIVTKMSPAFLSVLKSSSPAVFGLLASPQFLIGTAAVAGVTVVMFGGWKIFKKVQEAQAARQALAYESRPALPMSPSSEYPGHQEPAYDYGPTPTRRGAPTAYSDGVDEALVFQKEEMEVGGDVLDDDLSAIDSWRRGIIPDFGEAESADMELITPQAERARLKAIRREKGYDKDDDFDAKSRYTAKTSRTAKTGKTSSKPTSASKPKASSSSKTEKKSGGSSKVGAGGGKSKVPTKSPFRAIEDGRNQKDDAFNMVIRPKGERQSNMLKALFKNQKDKEKDFVRV